MHFVIWSTLQCNAFCNTLHFCDTEHLVITLCNTKHFHSTEHHFILNKYSCSSVTCTSCHKLALYPLTKAPQHSPFYIHCFCLFSACYNKNFGPKGFGFGAALQRTTWELKCVLMVDPRGQVKDTTYTTATLIPRLSRPLPDSVILPFNLSTSPESHILWQYFVFWFAFWESNYASVLEV